MADNGNNITLTINGRQITVPKGTTVLEAAKMNGIEIPTFCWHPKLKSVGACRICYVEIEKMPKLQVSCATEALPGMVVYTDTEKVKQGRRAVLEFILLNHPLDCPTCDKGGECDLQDNTFAHGIDDSRFDFDKYRFIRDRKATFDDYRLGPEIIRNQNRCILCYKCVRANKEMFGEYDLGAFQRGNITEIDAAPGEKVDSIYSGNLVEICPVGALTNSDWRYKIRVWKTQKIKSICSYCADGCNLTLWKERNRIYRTTSRRNDAIDEGWICDVGRYGYQIANAENRLTTPLIKKGDKQVPASWEEAIGLIARKFKEIKDKKGGVCIGGLVSANLDSASMYAFSKFFRTVLRSNNVDYRTDYKMLPEKGGDLYSKMVSRPFSITDIEKSDLIIVIGSNLINEHPIVNLRVRKAVTQKGALLFTLNPFATKSGDISLDEMVHTPGKLEALINGVCLSLIDKKLTAPGINTTDYSKLIESDSMDKIARETGVSAERLHSLATAIARARNITMIGGELIAITPARDAITAAIHNLALLGGIYDKGQIAFLARSANSRGAGRLGLTPFLSENMIASLKELWGNYPESEGKAADRMILAAKREEIDSLFVIGVNPLAAYPDGQFIKEGLEKLDFLVVADLFESNTTEIADVVLPLCSWAEYSGHFVNLEGTIQAFEAAMKPVSSSLPAFEIVNKIAAGMKEIIFDSVDQLHRETLSLLETDSASSHENKLLEVRYIEEPPHPDYPLPLFVFDDLHHFGHLTERSSSLAAFCNEAYVEISPSLAERLKLEHGSMVRVESEVGKTILPIRISEHVDSDVVLLSRNFAATPVNVLLMRKRRIDHVKLTRVEEA
jgi:NADH-quinone oxidoreductase chain G